MCAGGSRSRSVDQPAANGAYLARTEELRAQRDAAIATAVAEGTSQAEVGRILGVTRAHIGHLMERRR
jgi:CRP-like cAMP-binding protein